MTVYLRIVLTLLALTVTQITWAAETVGISDEAMQTSSAFRSDGSGQNLEIRGASTWAGTQANSVSAQAAVSFDIWKLGQTRTGNLRGLEKKCGGW